MNTSYVARDKTISLEPVIEYIKLFEEGVNNAFKIQEKEKAENEQLMHSHQKWTHYNCYESINAAIYYTDGGHIDYKNSHDFLLQITTRAVGIKHFYYTRTFNYWTLENGEMSAHSIQNKVDLNVSTSSFKLESEMSEDNPELELAAQEFLRKLDAMPIKMDDLIRHKNLIMIKTGFPIGLIIVSLLGFIVPAFSATFPFFRKHFWLFPSLLLTLGIAFGILVGGKRVRDAYAKLIPTKYGGYDTRTQQSYRVDDLDAFANEVDVLMGEKADLAKCRDTIRACDRWLTRHYAPDVKRFWLTQRVHKHKLL